MHGLSVVSTPQLFTRLEVSDEEERSFSGEARRFGGECIEETDCPGGFEAAVGVGTRADELQNGLADAFQREQTHGIF